MNIGFAQNSYAGQYDNADDYYESENPPINDVSIDHGLKKNENKTQFYHSEAGSIPVKFNFKSVENLNDTFFMIDLDQDSSNPPSEKDYFIEWKPNKKPLNLPNYGIESLGIENELTDAGYNVYNEYSPHFETYLKRRYDIELTQIITKKSELMSVETSKNNFNYVGFSPQENYKGATKLYPLLKDTQLKDQKIKVQPQELDFGEVPICTQATKDLIIRNLNLKGNSGLNVEIAEITTESPMIKVEHDDEFPILIRPGKDLTIKVVLNPQLIGPLSTVIILKTRNLYKFVILVKFQGINNEFGIQPIVVEKAYRVSPVINFSVKNTHENEMIIDLLDTEVMDKPSKVRIHQITKLLKDTSGGIY